MQVGDFQAVVFLVAIVGGVAALLFMNRRRVRLVEARYSSREELDEQKLRALFDPCHTYPRTELADVLGAVAKACRVVPGRLRPTDRISSLYGPMSRWELGDELQELYEALRLLHPDRRGSYRGVETVGDVVNAFFERV